MRSRLNASRDLQRQFAAKVLLESIQQQVTLSGQGGLLTAPEDFSGLDLSDEELLTIFEGVSLQRELEIGKRDRFGRCEEAALPWDVSRPWVDLRARDLARTLAVPNGHS